MKLIEGFARSLQTIKIFSGSSESQLSGYLPMAGIGVRATLSALAPTGIEEGVPYAEWLDAGHDISYWEKIRIPGTTSNILMDNIQETLEGFFDIFEELDVLMVAIYKMNRDAPESQNFTKELLNAVCFVRSKEKDMFVWIDGRTGEHHTLENRVYKPKEFVK